MTVVISWNVNGIRAVLKNGFMDWLLREQPDILCLQETRALPGDLSDDLLRPDGYISLWHPAKRRGYSGTAVYAKHPPLATGVLGIREFDDEGRLQVLEYPDFTILNGYWPNSQAERMRLSYKLAFCDAVLELAKKLTKKRKNVLVCGDFNIAHTEIDLANPKENENCAGYYIEEREAMTKFLKGGFVDTFRHFTKEPGHYTWWSYRTRARERNVGWRIDYHCVNKAFLARVRRSWILSDVMGSDHCPIGIELE